MWDILHTRLKRETTPKSASVGTPPNNAASDWPSEPHSASKISAAVNFKDLNLMVHDDDSSSDGEYETQQSSGSSSVRVKRRMVRSKQVIIMVGLPGRGKTWLCHKLRLYLNCESHSVNGLVNGLVNSLLNIRDNGLVNGLGGAGGHADQATSMLDRIEGLQSRYWRSKWLISVRRNTIAHGIEARSRALAAAVVDLHTYLAT
eukprot:gene30023-17917_t